MWADDSDESRRKRQKRDSSYKAKAFEKFKQLKNKGKNKYEVEELENVYETVDEKEYVKEVLDRRDDDWIVDDDGSGYVEDGRDIFDDDLDSESISAASRKGKGTKRKKKAISENAGKGNLHFMLSNLPAKKKEEKKLDDDDMLSELLNEIDESPLASNSSIKPLAVTKSPSVLSQKLAAKQYMKSFALPLPKRPPPRPTTSTSEESTKDRMTSAVLKEVQNKIKNEKSESPNKNNDVPDDTHLKNSVSINEESQGEEKIEVCTPDTQESQESVKIEVDNSQDAFEDDFDMTQIEEFESQHVTKTDGDLTSEDVAELMDEMQGEFFDEWEAMQEDVPNDTVNEQCDDIQLPLMDVDDRKVFRFFWWDAFEDAKKQPGVVFLFGKTYSEEAKTYVSCCVAVRDIQRRLFVLPRPHVKGSDDPVTFQDVYTEFNNEIMKPMQVKNFRARYVNKKYAFDPEVPRESDYMEVRYSAKDPQIEDQSTSGKTFSKIFGLNSSYLEILLLERKIKGPCWLDISNPVPVSNPVSWCKLEVDCTKPAYVTVTQLSKPLSPPPLVVATINMRCAMNPKNLNNEIVMISCLVHTKYAVDKQPPSPPFQQHFIIFTKLDGQILPLDIHEALKNYKATRVQKMDSERALLNYFISQFSAIDADLVVGHDLQGYQINMLSDQLIKQSNRNYSKLGRIRRTVVLKKQKLEKELFVGRLVCDIKISAKELIKSRSYDLDTLCQSVLKLKEGQRVDLDAFEVPKMYQTSQDILKLISLTMQDTAYILRIMYDLNVIPLALQITNIAGNVMSKTLLGGRSERNEFLLLHAFSEKDYIVPDKEFKSKALTDEKRVAASRKKPTYSGGLVLDPKVGFYDKLILLMDFNSLYPSIIQEYNICFTTMPVNMDEDNFVLPDKSLPPGILPTEIRKLVQSRREVKKLMNNSDISNDLRMQYHIRQMALKLTANSMYGCLGFSNSRFYAKSLAALVTYKGREILTNTRDLVQKLNFEVVYGDTDSIMINTNCLDYDEVFKIGVRIKQEVNKLYKQVELDIDGVFKYLLLLKKKKYAAVTITKTKDGALKTEKEYKGLDIVRRDWSQLASEAGKFILDHVLSDQSPDDRINNIHAHLTKLKEDLEANRVPLQLLVITKQLTKDLRMYNNKDSLPHVQVALRCNKELGTHYRAGDTVSYVICEDGTDKPATQRAYHIDELKSSPNLKIDINYYLSQQIHPVVSRICEPIEGTDAAQIALHLGLDPSAYKRSIQKTETVGENITKPEVKFRNVDKFIFKCERCSQDNVVDGVLRGNIPFLQKCNNSECEAVPADYIYYIQNQLTLCLRSYIHKYYLNEMTCEDPGCTNETTRLPLHFVKKFPVCTSCKNGVMYRKYTEGNLYSQLSYFHFIFDVNKASKKLLMEERVRNGYHILKETVVKFLNHSGFAVMNLDELFSFFTVQKKTELHIEEDSGVESVE